MARAVYYSATGPGRYRLSNYSSSQVRQFLSSGRGEQLDLAEAEFFEDLVELMRATPLLSDSLSDARALPDEVRLPDGGSIEFNWEASEVLVSEDGLAWLRHELATKLDFVLDPAKRRGGLRTRSEPHDGGSE